MSGRERDVERDFEQALALANEGRRTARRSRPSAGDPLRETARGAERQPAPGAPADAAWTGDPAWPGGATADSGHGRGPADRSGGHGTARGHTPGPASEAVTQVLRTGAAPRPTGGDRPAAPHRHADMEWSRARGVAARAGARVRPRPVLRPLDSALGQVLAGPLTALTDLPSFDTSAMDGWAVAGPGPWRVADGGQGILAGGDEPPAPLPDGHAVRIATGARVPPGATAVLRTEHGVFTAAGTGAAVADTGADAASGTPGAGTGTASRAPEAGTGAATREPHAAAGAGAAAGATPPGTGTDAVAGPPEAGRGADTAAGVPAVGMSSGAAAGVPAVGWLRAGLGRPVVQGQDIRPRGQECRSGDELLPEGTLVTPAVLGLAAAAGYDRLSTAPRPRVEVLVLGDELLSAGLPRDGRIRDALGPMLGPWLAALGAEVLATRHIPDDIEALASAVADSPAELLITTGGTASGPVDQVHPMLHRLGAELLVDGVAVRPGHPMLLARLDRGRHLVGLPGNPLAAVSGLLTLAEPLLRTLGGRAVREYPPAPLSAAVSGHPRDTRLVPVTYRGAEAVPLRFAGPAMLRGVAVADALAVIPPGGAARGTEVATLDLPWAAWMAGSDGPRSFGDVPSAGDFG
ncbi:hypothetical protein ACZ90_54760 [Streptomyces albus subsp. albus]|nr:hypothetical protein ACZ90_54760 [Streptomyces albus subsp. albus]